ncbi:hypothetical protein EBI01_00405 [Marinomonas rhizomae]|uniref:DUF3892 domain-containing protein n=1 Tax=Marinomonas rhizomae TaxID=491948 RepID=A0A366JFK3_9GAMM|nr:hypothetical protein [Marinomonas rhizomae]RBP85085.1 hypothetical protein DFP80_10282 [Marinomonas rhizomae]RNF76196.1 hypothetical protein EBI01_00405 [Marinomonas rhizomae]
MAKKPQVIVTEESKTGRNTKFKNTKTNEKMTRAEFVKEINKGNYGEYYVRDQNGVKTPVAKPNRDKSDNLD